MKNLKDTIYEKLKVDDIIIDKEFPIDGTIRDMIEFLKENGFKGTADGNFDSYQESSSKKAKCFNVDSSYSILWFTDTTKETISKRSPVFYIYKSSNTIECDRYDIFYINKSERIPVVINDKKVFLRELNKQFGWK